MINNQIFIHPQAEIHGSVKIDPFSVIHNDVIIGENTWIGSNVTVFPGSRIGKNCKIFPGAVIGAIPQDLKFNNEYTTLHIGDNTTVRECVTINRGTSDRNKTVVGKDCLLMAYVHVAHDCIIGNNVILANSVQLAGHVKIDDYAIVGGTSAVHQFVNIGQHVMISGGSLVRKDVPPYVKAARAPLSYAGVNSVGLRRRGYEDLEITQIQDMYRMLYLSGMNNSVAIEKIELECKPTIQRDEILNFFKSSKRGVIRSKMSKNNEDLDQD
ncbi:MAG: acyl-ACP--UDP-N-acetylglucosamine O-acyltransferase [Leadbetterella sp.]